MGDVTANNRGGIRHRAGSLPQRPSASKFSHSCLSGFPLICGVFAGKARPVQSRRQEHYAYAVRRIFKFFWGCVAKDSIDERDDR
jgi:hypothetical protein